MTSPTAADAENATAYSTESTAGESSRNTYSHPIWVPPSYDVTSSPSLLHTRTISQQGASSTNFARWAKWCPDGSTALAQCENASLEYIDFPHEALSPAPDISSLAHRSTSFPQPAPILDFVWYPRATCTDPASFCFVASVRECPVKLLDAADGRLRASYKIVDHRERQIAPHSLAFNPLSTKLYCGFEDAIEVFDVGYPGEGTRLRIISSLTFSSDMSSGLYAAGSFSPSAPTSSNIALFTEVSGEVPVMYVGDEDSARGFGIRSSVSQLMFNPLRPYLLYASFRRETSIFCWDIRGDVGHPIEVFDSAAPPRGGHSATHDAADVPDSKRKVAATNQRLRFDMDISGSWLGVGDQDGGIAIFSLHSAAEGEARADAASSRSVTSPALKFKAHNDAVGSVAFHPLRPLVLSVSGSRHFDTADSEDLSEEDGSDSDQDGERSASPRVPVRIKPKSSAPVPQDTTAKLWDFTHAS
ncbi:hypothetical protein NM688_g9070 [Phlebia brevispora]|uniref:Uncharacterized protein n=1 Tax=Phlebia brevispora TaxID=194682 RepID=A0ACC1RKZ2_9APHY|nr:hypothetical protein NM688_g9070 [Phlebia brevispora]